jgi:hypothetical protein
MHNAIADRVWLARDLVRRCSIEPQFLSVSDVSRVTLTDLLDIKTAVVDIGDLLDDLMPVIFWSNNGTGHGIPGGLVCQNGTLEFLLYNVVRLPLLGGITPETLTRLLASELGYTTTTVLRVTLFIKPALPLPEALLNQHDRGFGARVRAVRRQRWPRIFPQEYYRDRHDRPRNRCAPWAMGGDAPVKVAGSDPLIGCNFFLNRCQCRA